MIALLIIKTDSNLSKMGGFIKKRHCRQQYNIEIAYFFKFYCVKKAFNSGYKSSHMTTFLVGV